MSRSIKGNKQAVKQLYSVIKAERYTRTVKHVNTLTSVKNTTNQSE